jgi:hypothetical protein
MGGYAHSGSASLQLGMNTVTSGSETYNETNLDLNDFTLDEQIQENGIIVKLWLKISGSNDAPSSMRLKVDHPSMSTKNKSIAFEQVARVGEWVLYQASVSNFEFWPEGNYIPYIYIQHVSTTASLYIDDIRMQPSNSQATTYVYDMEKLRLISQFDDQNFGLFYQYNEEGKLIRKLVETERGMKTVSETQYNTPLSER